MPRFPLSALAAALLTGAAPATGPGPRWTADGALIRPDSVDRWVTVGTSLGLGYNDPTATGAGRFQPLFHRVYLEPRAYATARRTGRFPRGTMLALVLAPATERVAPARQGVFADRAVAAGGGGEGPGTIPRRVGLLRFRCRRGGRHGAGVPARAVRALSRRAWRAGQCLRPVLSPAARRRRRCLAHL